MRQVRAGTRAELATRRVLYVALTPDSEGRPRDAVVVLDTHGNVRAYRDLCRHLPIPLDLSRRYLSPDRRYLVCATHGARFHVDDGMCERGPCVGLHLFSLPLREDAAGELWVIDPG